MLSPSLLLEIADRVEDSGFQSRPESYRLSKVERVYYLLKMGRMMISETECEIMRVLREYEQKERIEI